MTVCDDTVKFPLPRQKRGMGEDMLHTGCNGIYAPTANLHRSAYGGRRGQGERLVLHLPRVP